MNILFFLTPKNDVEFLYDTFTVRQALEKMQIHRYSAIPIINKDGEYVETITEGDLLWAIKDKSTLNIRDSEHILISDIDKHIENHPVNINADIEDLVTKSMNQNFVPVVDDKNIFIGIVTRKDIIGYMYKKILEK